MTMTINWKHNCTLIPAGWLMLALAIAFAGFARASTPTVVIKDNPGGSLIAFLLQGEEYRSLGARLVVDGACNSACTLYMRLPNICITPKASFGFHAPRYAMGSKAGELAPDATRYMMKVYPKWVQTWVTSNGGLAANLIIMPYSYAKNFLPTCGAA